MSGKEFLFPSHTFEERGRKRSGGDRGNWGGRVVRHFARGLECSQRVKTCWITIGLGTNVRKDGERGDRQPHPGYRGGGRDSLEPL